MTVPDAMPLIPRAALFGNPVKSQAQISPDGAHISWLAPLDGVMNLFVAPHGDLPRMRTSGRFRTTYGPKILAMYSSSRIRQAMKTGIFTHQCGNRERAEPDPVSGCPGNAFEDFGPAPRRRAHFAQPT